MPYVRRSTPADFEQALKKLLAALHKHKFILIGELQDPSATDVPETLEALHSTSEEIAEAKEQLRVLRKKHDL